MNMINEALLNLFRHPGTGLHLFIVVAKGRRSKPATLTSSMIVVYPQQLRYVAIRVYPGLNVYSGQAKCVLDLSVGDKRVYTEWPTGGMLCCPTTSSVATIYSRSFSMGICGLS